MVSPEHLRAIEERFVAELRHHLAGWLKKATQDLCEEQFDAEVASLDGDPLYNAFGLASPEYALIRLMGRLSISIGRRLGEIYDKVPRLAQARFGLTDSDVAPKIGGKLELDIGVPLNKLSKEDARHVQDTVKRFLPGVKGYQSVGAEIRYNFNPNDSARLRKDCEMASLLTGEGYLPVYLIFSTISPRDEAIARLTRAGWTFLVGDAAARFLNELIGVNFEEILRSPLVSKELTREMKKIMDLIYRSHAVKATLARYT